MRSFLISILMIFLLGREEAWALNQSPCSELARASHREFEVGALENPDPSLLSQLPLAPLLSASDKLRGVRVTDRLICFGAPMKQFTAQEIQGWISSTDAAQAAAPPGRRKLLLYIRSKLYDALTSRLDHNQIPLRDVQDLIFLERHLEEIRRPHLREFVLTAAGNAEFDVSLITLGSIYRFLDNYRDHSEAAGRYPALARRRAEIYTTQIEHEIASVLPSVLRLESGLRNAVLSDLFGVLKRKLVERISSFSHLSEFDPEGDTELFHFSNAYSNTFEALQELLDQRSQFWSASARSMLSRFPAEVRRDFMLSMSLFPAVRGSAILEQLVMNPIFVSLGAVEQSAVFFSLNYASHVAERTQVQRQREVLQNTISQVLKVGGLLRILVIQENYLGQATVTHPVLNARYFSQLPPVTSLLSEKVRQEWVTKASLQLLEVLAHEVSHVISGQRVEAHARYFEEEMRAKAVGFLAAYGRLMTPYEAGRYAVYLMMNTDCDAYREIARAWRASPHAFFGYLGALGFHSPESLVDKDEAALYQIVEAFPRRGEGATWGSWEGYLVNAAKPNGVR